MNTIGGVSCWRAISTTHQIPVVAAAVVLTHLALIVSFCGYKFIHLYEKFAGYPVLIAFLVSTGTSAKYMDLPGRRLGPQWTCRSRRCSHVWLRHCWIRDWMGRVRC